MKMLSSLLAFSDRTAASPFAEVIQDSMKCVRLCSMIARSSSMVRRIVLAMTRVAGIGNGAGDCRSGGVASFLLLGVGRTELLCCCCW